MASMDKLKSYAIVITSLAVIVLTGIAVLNEYQDNGHVDNTTADNFISGLTIFGSFIGVLVIAVIGKMIMGLFTSGGGKGGYM